MVQRTSLRSPLSHHMAEVYPENCPILFHRYMEYPEIFPVRLQRTTLFLPAIGPHQQISIQLDFM